MHANSLRLLFGERWASLVNVIIALLTITPFHSSNVIMKLCNIQSVYYGAKTMRQSFLAEWLTSVPRPIIPTEKTPNPT